MANDGWNNFEREETDSSGLIRGERVSFKAAGAEYVTDSGELLSEGDEFVVLTMIEVWSKFAKGERPIHFYVAPGDPRPKRGSLGDMDQTKWKLGLGTELEDPWKNARYLHLYERLTSMLYTLVGETKGLRVAVTKLGDQITARRRNGHPNAIPVIKLSSADFGQQKRPVFEVIDWLPGHPEGFEPPEIKAVLPPPIAIERKPEPRSDGPIDDDIPF